jgi:hypothetical protein
MGYTVGAEVDYGNGDVPGGDDTADDDIAVNNSNAPGETLPDLTLEPMHEEDDEDVVASARLTGMVVHTVLTAGQHKGPLPRHGQQKVLDLIHSPQFDPSKVLVKRAADVKKFIKVMVDDDDCMLTDLGIDLQEGDPPEWKSKVAALFGTNALDACVHMLHSKEVSEWMEWEVQGPHEGIGSPLTGERAWRRARIVKDKWGEDVHYVPLTFFSDKTHLNLKGTHKCHPGFLKLCGWKLPFSYTRRAARLVVLMPDPPLVAWDRHSEQGSKFKSASAWKDFIKMRKQDLHHAALNTVLQPLKEHSRYWPFHMT